jgi:hypothetical protein
METAAVIIGIVAIVVDVLPRIGGKVSERRRRRRDEAHNSQTSDRPAWERDVSITCTSSGAVVYGAIDDTLLDVASFTGNGDVSTVAFVVPIVWTTITTTTITTTSAPDEVSTSDQHDAAP